MNYLYEPILNHQYNASDKKPIILDFTVRCKNEIINSYLNKGFAIYELIENTKDVRETLNELARFLSLGKPYEPIIYKNTDIYKSGINQLSVTEGPHIAFQTRNAQDLHCDGTLEEIGMIRTSLLHCVKPAQIGGETAIFNSVGAFHNLYKVEENRDILEYLFKVDSLKRCAINLTGAEYIGPAFKIINQKLISRFSKDNTSCWEESFIKYDFIKKAYKLIDELTMEESSYLTKVKLKKNQGLIIANDRVAHGRTAFCDNERILFRALFKEIID